MSTDIPVYRQNAIILCGRCGVSLSARHADLSEEGYRCLSCSTDETLRAAADEERRDAERLGALQHLRVSVFAVMILSIFIVFCSVPIKIGAGVLALLSGYWAYKSILAYRCSFPPRTHKL